MLNYTKEEYHKILQDLYNKKGSYITNAELTYFLNTNPTTLRKDFINKDVFTDCPDVFLHIQKPIKVFKDITMESSYWLGYLLADGCLAVKQPRNKNSNITYRLMLECKIDDKEILEKFCDFIQIRKERIGIGQQGKSSVLSLSVTNCVNDLISKGIVPNKSYKEHHIPEEIKNNEDLFFQYLKGIIDGDGTIHNYKNSPGISFVSNSLIFIEEVKEELKKYLPFSDSIWITTIPREKKASATQELYSLKVGAGPKYCNLFYIYTKFYKNKKIILTRKYENFTKMLNFS